MQHVYNLLCPWCIRQYIKTLGFELVFMCVHCVLEYVTWEWKNSMPKLALPLDFDFQYMCKNFNPLLMWLHFLAHLFILYVRRFLISKPFRAIMKLGKQWKETSVYFQPFSSCYKWVQIHIYGYISTTNTRFCGRAFHSLELPCCHTFTKPPCILTHLPTRGFYYRHIR
jgi:hypothetical protein